MVQTRPIALWRSCSPPLPGESHLNLCYVRDLDSVWPGWRQPGMHQQIDLSNRQTARREEPWPKDSGPEFLA